jgi:hypothetical protein
MKQKSINEAIQRFYEFTNPMHITIEQYNKLKDFLVEEITQAHYLGQQQTSSE